MDVLLSPRIAYLLIFTGVMLLLVIFSDTKYSLPKMVAMALCFLAGIAEFLVLKGNPWGFLIVLLSPLPYFIAIRQERIQSPLYILTIFMLSIGSDYLFVDESGSPLINVGVARMVSVFGGLFVWFLVAYRQSMQTARKATLIGETVVGMTGEVWVAIEPSAPGSVKIEGNVWRARSQEIIPAGTLVRVIAQKGITLTVKKIENLLIPKK
jgi:membrane protein implicated in regulation of membrane protease activity